ncbi:hypothetical protein A0J48_016660 [Sphaerospermopsis aphanizomenoides BCCUSP55]|uniref:hypothetical protein n=1 Tax=Sphaerospermopsis aphanizomenoides TaxID=459663 RepID=UPI001903AB46|nr:hypothetical protein [Sphaerospermopsis aphanizomenoides]MBK1989151.1 hypothetical protein [Sphaerospermopsis aphanizomenoides BCCUSP55]
MTDVTSNNLGSGADAMDAGSWYNDAYYQILLVEPNPDQSPGKLIRTKIITAKRIRPENTENTENTENKSEKYFSEYKLDNKTIERLSDHPKPPDFDQNNISIATYLPSTGVVFPRGFMETLMQEQQSTPMRDYLHQYSIESSNFYEPIRSLLYTRKISQLIAKTWYTYLTAKEGAWWDYFTKGEWNKFIEANQEADRDQLDGLIAREIFLAPQNACPDEFEPDNLDIYYPLKSHYDKQKTRFLILPNSLAWQGIGLSLLIAGQAYYAVTKNGETRYHQISQPILSTGEIVIKYGLEVSWDKFRGDVQELSSSPGNNSIAFQVVLPYPPIPTEHNLSRKQIQKWADAQDDPDENDVNNQLPFYHQTMIDNKKQYLVDVRNFSPPYPYIPLSCS